METTMETAVEQNRLRPMPLSSILKKALMAITGLFWFVYLIVHLAGNLLLVKGAESFNFYAETLGSNPLVVLAEIALLVTILVHIFSALRVSRENNKARPHAYAYKVPSTGSSTFASRTMWYGGVILLLFIIVHVWMFKYGDHAGAGGLWGLVVRSFKHPLIVVGYVIAMLPLGLHLSHGFGSAFQTLGVVAPSWRLGLRRTGRVLGWILAVGFLCLPLWAFFFAEV
jgi:succinate dehydrogenase / fumarate reductase cytochrome b subunit